MQDGWRAPGARPRVVVIGGGLTAASLVVQLMRSTPVPLDVTVIEPRERTGPGLAYSATDPDHRLNAPLDVHWIDPRRPLELRHWFEANAIARKDPACLTPNGQVFMRRADLGTYLVERFDAAASEGPEGSSLRHVRACAASVAPEAGTFRVRCDNGEAVTGDMLFVATGNAVAALRAPFQPGHESDPRIVANPLAPRSLDRVAPSARVLVVGSGLTALDIVSTLVRRQHRGGIVVVSRRGYRPRPQSPESLSLPPRPIELAREIPGFLQDAPATVAAWTRALRRHIRQAESAGMNWYGPFDSVRDVVWQLWPRLPAREKDRFLRRLRVFYDVHRFRTPPMNEELVAQAERQGLVRHAAAALRTVEPSPTGVHVQLAAGAGRTEWDRFDCVVNCTGLDAASAGQSNPALRSLLEAGLLRSHETGIGFDVDGDCSAFDASGRRQAALRVIGPPSAGVFGDPVAIPFIANQVQRILPDVLRTLQSLHRNEDPNREPTPIE